MKPFFALIILLVALAGCAAAPPAAAPVPTIEVGNVALGTQSALIAAGTGRLTDGDLAPDFSYTMADGSSHTLSELRGKRVVLNFWATWCMPCREEMPQLQQLADEHSADLVVLAVNRNEAPAAIAKFGNEVGVTFPLIANIAGDIADRYGATSLPLSYFINSEGTISSHQLGVLTPAILARHMEGLQ